VFSHNYDKERWDLFENDIIDDNGDAHDELIEMGYSQEYLEDEDNIDELANALADKGYDHVFCRLVRMQRANIALKDLRINGY